MASQFHNRLVGTIVLVALGVIFLPDLLDGKKAREEEQFSEIPLRPATERRQTTEEHYTVISEPVSDDASVELPPASDDLSSADISETGKETSSAKPVNTTDKAKGDESKSAAVEQNAASKVDSLKSSSVAKSDQPAFTLQLGSFNNATNVAALVTQLRKAGFTAYTLPERPVDGQLTKVFVGPDVSEAKLKKLQQDIEKLTRLKGRVVPYNPLES